MTEVTGFGKNKRQVELGRLGFQAIKSKKYRPGFSVGKLRFVENEKLNVLNSKEVNFVWY